MLRNSLKFVLFLSHQKLVNTSTIGTLGICFDSLGFCLYQKSVMNTRTIGSAGPYYQGLTLLFFIQRR